MNLKDLSRALRSIATNLKSIDDTIDAIEPGGGGSSSTIDYSSSDEHEIGTWSDGNTLYERIIHVDAASADSGWVSIDVSEYTNENSIGFVANSPVIPKTNTTEAFSIPWFMTSSLYANAAYIRSSQTVIHQIKGYGGYDAYLRFQYTRPASE